MTAYALSFELAYNTFTDVTADWCRREPLTIERGFVGDDPVASAGRLEVTLHNPDGRYTAGHPWALAGFGPGIAVTLAADGVMLFFGRLARVETDLPGAPGLARCIALDESEALWHERLGAFPLLTDASPREVIRALTAGLLLPPGLWDRWRLGHPATAPLGGGTKLAGIDEGCAYDDGQSTIAWAGDTWGEETSPGAALREVVTSEWGRFFIAADGTPTFEDRHARPRRVTAAASFSAGISGIRAALGGADMASRVEVRVTPREVGDAEGIIWEAGSALRLRAGERRELRAAFNDPDEAGQIVGAISGVQPEPGTDFTACERADPADPGADVTDMVSVTAAYGTTSARLRLVNSASRTIYIHGLRLRGVPLRQGAPVTAVRADDAARFAHGERTLRISLPLGDDPDMAADLATYLLAAHKEPRPAVTLALDARENTAWAGLELGDRISVTGAALGLANAPFFIEAIGHRITGGAHAITLRGAPADRWAYLCLDTASFGIDSRLAY